MVESNVVSVFDGMACGMLAMMEAGVKVGRYVAFEIEKYAIKSSSHNFPEIEHRGDVFQADFTEFEGFDWLVGGSPCTYWAICQKNGRELEAGERAGLSEREKVYTNAYIRYGEVCQAVVAMEELSECQKEIAKFVRGLGDDGRLAEEVADALICLEQIMMVRGIRERVDSQMRMKVMRLDLRLRQDAGEVDEHG